jgi:acetyl-CoA acyltransferase
MTKFEKPGSRDWDYTDMVRESVTAALADAGVGYDSVEQAFAGFVFGDSCSGERALYEVGLSGIPVVNVNNNCASGSSALFLATQMVRGGIAECTLAFGFEKMKMGSLAGSYDDRESVIGLHLRSLRDAVDINDSFPMAPQMFALAGQEHMRRFGSTAEHFAWVGWKNHKHSTNNPYAQFQKEFTLAQVAEAPMVMAPLTKLQCSPTSDGSAAAVIASEAFVDRHDLWDRAIEIKGQALRTDSPQSVTSGSVIDLVGTPITRAAAEAAYRQAEIAPADLDVIELHDCFSTNEVFCYEGLGLAAEGEGHLLIDSQDTTYGGRWVVNPSGGLISKGHPLGATGLAQCAELTWQLRGKAGERQVDNAALALQHNLGLGGACVVTIYGKP